MMLIDTTQYCQHKISHDLNNRRLSKARSKFTAPMQTKDHTKDYINT